MLDFALLCYLWIQGEFHHWLQPEQQGQCWALLILYVSIYPFLIKYKEDFILYYGLMGWKNN